MWPGRVHQLKVFIFGWHFFMLFRLPREASRGKMRLSLSIIRRASFVVDLLQCWSMMHPRGMCAIANFRIHRSVDGYFIFTVSLKKMHRQWRYSTQQYILWGEDAIGNEVTGAHLMDTEPNIVSLLVYVVLHHPPANNVSCPLTQYVHSTCVILRISSYFSILTDWLSISTYRSSMLVCHSK